jgi:hypothetical protein
MKNQIIKSYVLETCLLYGLNVAREHWGEAIGWMPTMEIMRTTSNTTGYNDDLITVEARVISLAIAP